MKWIRAILNLKICDTPQWLQYLPFAAFLFNATLWLFVCPTFAWQAVRFWQSSQWILRLPPATLPIAPNYAVIDRLRYVPFLFLGIALLFGLAGALFLRAAMKQWRKLKMVRGFEVVDRK